MSSARAALLVTAGLAFAGLFTVVVLSRVPDSASANPATAFASISSGGSHTCGVTTGGAVKCWGDDSYGQLGDGGACGGGCAVPVQVTGLTSGTASVAAGTDHTCAVTTAGAAKCWGRNDYGQLGDGTTVQHSTPVAVSGLGSGVMAISEGEVHSCALLAAGSIRCWGRNNEGQLGDASLTDHYTPVAVYGIGSGATGVEAGAHHTCAVLAGDAKCWGRNASGELGDGTMTPSNIPVSVSGLTSSVMQVAAGFNFTCARVGGGAVKCWGSNVGGQLGDGQACSPYACSTPVSVSGLSSGALDLTAGGSALGPGSPQACALTQSGAKCWGDNWNGELGVNTNMQPHPVPIGVSGETTDFVHISSGGHHGCAVTESGGAKCWGLNTSGQLGIGMSGSAFNSPQVVVAAMVKSTPTPTPSPTPCPPLACPVDFHLSVDSDPTLGVACETSGGSTSCAAPAGSTLHVKVYLDALADGLPYQAVQVLLDYAGVTPDGSLHIYTVWPDCSTGGAEVVQPTYLVTSCSLLYVPPYSTYLGVIGLADFACSSTGSLTLAHGVPATLLIDDNGVTHYETTGDETVTIDCVDPAAYPTDTDGDGCPDISEALPSPLSGGERNFLNPYDYFNPSHDGQNRIDDILDVVDQYYIDSGNPNYNPDTDRTLLGPNAWNLGPPNGQQRVDDILNMVYQYYHDCS